MLEQHPFDDFLVCYEEDEPELENDSESEDEGDTESEKEESEKEEENPEEFLSPENQTEENLPEEVFETDTEVDGDKDEIESFIDLVENLIRSRAERRFKELCALSAPIGEESLQYLICQSSGVSKKLVEEIDEDRLLYRNAFKKYVDLLENEIEVYSELFTQKMDKATEFVRYRSGEALMEPVDDDHEYLATEIRAPTNEDELLIVSIDLMENTSEMKRKWSNYVPDLEIPFCFAPWFTPFVVRWLDLAEKKTLGWVHGALEMDDFQPQGSNTTSSSPTDMFTAVFEALSILKRAIAGFERDREHYAIFMSRFARIVSCAVEKYAKAMENWDPAASKEKNETENENSTSNLWNWLSSSHDKDDSKNEEMQKSICVRISNLELARKRISDLYQEANGPMVVKAAKEWLETKGALYRRGNTLDRDPEEVTGIIKMGIYQAENLEEVSTVLSSGKVNSYVIIREALPEPEISLLSYSTKSGDSVVTFNGVQVVEVARTQVVPCSSAPLFQLLNPDLLPLTGIEGQRKIPANKRKKFKFLQEPVEFTFVSEKAKALEVEVHHRADLNSNKDTAKDVMVGRGILRLQRSYINPGRNFFWVDLEPQGRVLVSIDLVMEGVPIKIPQDKRTNLQKAIDRQFGIGGVQTLIYWFHRMNTAIQVSRENLIGRIIAKVCQNVLSNDI